MNLCNLFLLAVQQFITLCLTQYLGQYGRSVVLGEGIGGVVHYAPVVVFYALAIFLTPPGLLEINLTTCNRFSFHLLVLASDKFIALLVRLYCWLHNRDYIRAGQKYFGIFYWTVLTQQCGAINLIVTPCIFVESLQFINQRMHI